MVSLARRYYHYRASLSSGFYLPVFVVFIESRGLGLPEIGFVQGTVPFSMVVWVLPTGYLGDRLGRRAALALVSGTPNVLEGRIAETVGPVQFLSTTGVAVSLAAAVFWLAARPVRNLEGDPAPS